MLTLDQLKAAVRNGSIDTVVVAFTDMQGRLLGKRVQGRYFVDHDVAAHGIEGCNYLLALDMEMEPVPGYALANWDAGYGDFRARPDLTTLRRIPWLEATALVLCDVELHDGTHVAPSPRQVLKRQVEKAHALGLEPMFASELEFFVFGESYEEARAKRYRGLTPSAPYILDYHVLAASYDEPLIRQLRNGMQAAGIPVESSKGEAWPGQHEVNFVYSDAVTMADNHAVYKNGAKEIAHQNGCSITFMAKPDESWIGSSCHIHSSLWKDGENVFAGESETFERYLAGQIACTAELAVFLAPTVNSYKRFTAGSWAPTTLAWGHDNRTCGFRVVGEGSSLRVETRIPGGDANPYLAFAALLAAGLHGIENELGLPPALAGNAYDSDAQRFPQTLYEAIEALEGGSMAREAFGDDVVEHYLHHARTEQRLYDEAVTDYERRRMFERG
jgi:glutamine synthetase